MKKIKLTKAEVLAGLLLLLLLLIGENLWAQGYKMTSDVICATGGKSESTGFKMKVSAGGQGSPIGPQSSDNFQGFGGWIYTTEDGGSAYARGDANCNGVIEVGDVVYLINYLFKGGPAPLTLKAGDANADFVIDVGDVVYLINYLFKGGPPPQPSSGKSGGVLAKASRVNSAPGHAQISLVLSQTNRAIANVLGLSKASLETKDKVFEILVKAKFDRDVAGVQLDIDFDPDQVMLLDPSLTPMTKNLQLYASTKDGVQKIGILDLTGEKLIPAGEGALVTLRAKGVVQGSSQEYLSSIKINKAVLVDKDAMPLALELSRDLKSEGIKALSVQKPDFQEAMPQDFSLSQNYPNPFNPETDI